MIFRVLIFYFVVLCVVKANAQDEFCNALTTIMRDAPAKFRDVRGNVINNNQNATTWSCGIKIPGTISSRFVSAMGLFYEGAMLQTKNKEDIQPIYDKYKQMLGSCLSALDYTTSATPNFYPGLENYKKLAFLPKMNNDKLENTSGHVTMEVTYSKEVGLYTIVIYIFEH